MSIQQISGFLTPYAYETITVDNTVGGVGFTTTLLDQKDTQVHRDFGRARYVFVTVETANIRYTVDGTVPVATGPGHLLETGSSLTFINSQAAKNFRAIRDTGSNGTLRVTYFR